MSNLQDLQNATATAAFKMTKSEAHAKFICIDCKSPIRDEREDGMSTGEPGQVYSDAGAKEYDISGMCETCYDNLFNRG